MRDPKKAKLHLSHAHTAIKDGDGAKARHHVGHALAALKEGMPTEYRGKDYAPARDENASSTTPKLTLMQRLKAMHLT